MVEEASIDKKGRIVIPRHLREGLGLHEGAKVRLTLEAEKILITKPITLENSFTKWKVASKKTLQYPR